MVGARLNILHDQIRVYRESDPHLVQGFARSNLAAASIVAGYVIRLRIDEMTFDIPQAIVTEIAAAFDTAGVHWFTVD